MSADGLRIRHQEGRSQQPDRPRGRRGAAARAAGGRSASACSSSLVLLFSAWQHFELLRHGYQIEGCSASARPRKRSTATCGSRSRRCASPRRIEQLATEQLHLVAPSRDQAIVIERVTPVGAAREIHRRGALSPAIDGRSEDRWRTNTAADSGCPGAVRRSASCGASAAAAAPSDWRDTMRARLLVCAALFALLDRRRSKRGCLPAGRSSTPT